MERTICNGSQVGFDNVNKRFAAVISLPAHDLTSIRSCINIFHEYILCCNSIRRYGSLFQRNIWSAYQSISVVGYALLCHCFDSQVKWERTIRSLYEVNFRFSSVSHRGTDDINQKGVIHLEQKYFCLMIKSSWGYFTNEWFNGHLAFKLCLLKDVMRYIYSNVIPIVYFNISF